jgi:Cu+-exporting ATPase
MALTLLLGAPSVLAQAPAKDGPKQAVVTVKGMQCPFCAYGIRKHLAKLPGVERVEVELAKNQAIVTFKPGAEATEEQIRKAVRDAGFTAGQIAWRAAGKGDAAKASKQGDVAAFVIEGMRCLGCEAKITADLEALPGVSFAQVDWDKAVATVRYDRAKATPEDMIRTIEQAGKFQATLKTDQPGGSGR